MSWQRLAVCLWGVALLASSTTLARGVLPGVCDVDDRGADRVASDRLPADDADADVARAERSDRVIVPCAMVESGYLGPACADANVYVVTSAGVLLCEVDFAAVQPPPASEPAFQDGNGEASPPPSSSAFALCAGPTGFAAILHERIAPPPTSSTTGPRDGFALERLRPS